MRDTRAMRPEGHAEPAPEPADSGTMAYEDWKTEGVLRFGRDFRKWAFVCPVCGHVARVGDFEQHGVKADAATMECLGRYEGMGEITEEDEIPVPCDYAGYGLIQISPVRVKFPDGTIRKCFDFADE